MAKCEKWRQRGCLPIIQGVNWLLFVQPAGSWKLEGGSAFLVIPLNPWPEVCQSCPVKVWRRGWEETKTFLRMKLSGIGKNQGQHHLNLDLLFLCLVRHFLDLQKFLCLQGGLFPWEPTGNRFKAEPQEAWRPWKGGKASLWSQRSSKTKPKAYKHPRRPCSKAEPERGPAAKGVRTRDPRLWHQACL